MGLKCLINPCAITFFIFSSLLIMNSLILIIFSVSAFLIQPIARASEKPVAINQSDQQAACNEDLFGTWTLIYESTSLDQGKTAPLMSMIQTFDSKGKTNLKIDPFLDATNTYNCVGNKLTINKIVPTNLNLIRLNATEMVYLEEGTEQYFYFSK